MLKSILKLKTNKLLKPLLNDMKENNEIVQNKQNCLDFTVVPLVRVQKQI